MDTSTSAALEVTGFLETLCINSHANNQDMLQVLPNSNVGAQGELTLSRADASEVNRRTELGIYYMPSGYSSPRGYYPEVYDYPACDWANYWRHVTADGVEPQVPASLSETTLVYHPSGFAYNPHHMYAPYSSGMPSRESGQSGNASHGNPGNGNLYQPSVLPNASTNASSVPAIVEVLKKNSRDSFNKNLRHIAAGDNFDHLSVGTRPTYADPSSSLHERILPKSPETPGSQDVRVGYEGRRTGASWLGSYNLVEGQQLHALSSSSLLEQFGRPLAPLLPNVPSSHMHHPRIPGAAFSGSSGRGLEQTASKHSRSANSARRGTFTGLTSQRNGNQWSELEKGKPWSRGSLTSNTGRLNWNMLNEQNKGPRTVRGRQNRTNSGAARCSRLHDLHEPVSLPVNNDEYNQPDFETTYDNAKFFIIKSYSEDDIHKSIKYSIWASTVNGNKKLDAAYHEAQASSRICPLFLFFSVNASGQFCGVAEMVGPVDFNSSLDFWQQDKWMGKVPVKWHIVKDVPNSHFRHIVLENNDNKPVTNSRDTQEVPLSQGSEMLNIFKTHSLKTSILDDFPFYETRQRVMQEKKARQQTQFHLQQADSKGVNEKSEQKDMAGSMLQSVDAKQSVDHIGNKSKYVDVIDRVGSLKGGTKNNQTDRSKVTPGEGIHQNEGINQNEQERDLFK